MSAVVGVWSRCLWATPNRESVSRFPRRRLLSARAQRNLSNRRCGSALLRKSSVDELPQLLNL
jgi:hypothetical protein